MDPLSFGAGLLIGLALVAAYYVVRKATNAIPSPELQALIDALIECERAARKQYPVDSKGYVSAVNSCLRRKGVDYIYRPRTPSDGR